MRPASVLALALLAGSASFAQETRSRTLDLATALQLAGASSVEVEIARSRLDAARATSSLTTAQFLPWLSAGVTLRGHGGLIQDVVGNVVTADKRSYSVGAALNLQVELGDVWYRAKAAKQTTRAAAEGVATERQEAQGRAAQGYFDLLVAQGLVAAADESVRVAREYETQLDRAVEAGLALKGDLLRARVQRLRNELTRGQADEQRRLAAVRLAESLRVDPKTALVAEDRELVPLVLVEKVNDLDALIQEAASARPELRELSAALEAAEFTQKAASTGPLFPTFGGQLFLGGLGGSRDDLAGRFGGSRDYVATLSWRFGPGGIFDSARKRLAEAHLSEVRWNGERLKDRVTRQVAEASARVITQGDQLRIATEALTAATEGLALARARREFEVGIVLENILAEQDQTRARQEYVRTLGEYDKAQYALARALGRLGRD